MSNKIPQLGHCVRRTREEKERQNLLPVQRCSRIRVERPASHPSGLQPPKCETILDGKLFQSFVLFTLIASRMLKILFRHKKETCFFRLQDGMTALLWSAHIGDQDGMKRLLSAGANADRQLQVSAHTTHHCRVLVHAVGLIVLNDIHLRSAFIILWDGSVTATVTSLTIQIRKLHH